MPKRLLQIAIDGPAASGKSTVARLLAQRLAGYYINTGDMYRTVSWLALEHSLDVHNRPDAVAAMLTGVDLQYGVDSARNDPVLCLGGAPVPMGRIRAPDVARIVSHVAAIPAVREWLRERQRATRRLGTIIMEGRDIGTVILPDASHKFFLTASPEVRARRRLAQAGEVPADATVASVAAEIAERDRIDSTRPVAPLKPAADAVLINADDLTVEQVVEAMLRHIGEGEAR
ncbi:MAG: cytidylate kinase [Lentisphaerae bacterium RIFOXYB12_FULL_65_16]|nr:MAG: cytidylate kinase [Lentisphaerae bacterium RIFOXYA12_64_32]OGV84557.1 MAG: cytidylate kinase [Lentisphaerae bacterium RIFOXYB12_FULL_65_16]